MVAHSIEEAMVIAAKDLRWCYRERGIITGSRLVYWSWDSFFASLGAIKLGDTAVVRKNLELYILLQRQDGAIPKRIAHPLYWMKFIGFPIVESQENQRPTFWNSYYTAMSLAQNPIIFIALYDYVKATNDWEFFYQHLPRLERILAYLERKEDGHGLLKEGMGGGWAESILKRGAISFTNMCYARALWSMAELCREGVVDQGLVEQYERRYAGIKSVINSRLWSEDGGGFYSDWFGHLRHHHFATDGNLLAIWWGIADGAQAKKIQEKINYLALESDVPIKLAYDPYDYWRIFFISRIAGIKDYHVGYSWLWLGCVDVLVKLRMHRKDEAIATLGRIAEKIQEDGTVHEIYDKGKAVKTLLYKSENPWAWGAGMFLLACSEAGFSLPK
jgi:glycogen debranching enzyme